MRAPQWQRRRWPTWVLVLRFLGMACVIAYILFSLSQWWALFHTFEDEPCQDNLQAIAGAMQVYSEDWDGRLPPADHWCDALDCRYHQALHSNPGVGRVFACSRAGTPYSYAMNSKLSCARLAEIPHPDKTPLIFETAKTRRNANDALTSRRRPGRHGKWSYVLFADLQCRGVDDDQEISP